MNNIIASVTRWFQSAQEAEATEKDLLVQKLFEKGHINIREVTILLRTVEISINADKIEMSSGAKIVGGSDFESRNYPG